MLLGQQGPTYYVVIGKGAAPLAPPVCWTAVSVHRVKTRDVCLAWAAWRLQFCWSFFEKNDETAVFFEKNYKNA